MKALPRTDSTLQLSRRLDWRFLLPEPHLRRVAYVGPSQSSLANALEQFSEKLKIFTVVENANPRLYEAAFDLVVMAEPALAQLENVQQWLAPRGYLYAEAQHAWDWRNERRLPARARSLPTIEEWCDRLARLGFVEIKGYWHRPSFEHAVQIIPLRDASARDFVFSRRAEDFMSQLKFATGRTLMNKNWLARLLQCVSITACKA